MQRSIIIFIEIYIATAHMIISLITWLLLDAQSCVDTAVNAQQQGTDTLGNFVNVVVPRSNFSCNGRITGFMASLNRDGGRLCNNPLLFVWQPDRRPTVYSFRSAYQLNDDDIVAIGNYHFANMSLTGDDRLEFQSGDAIGYQHRFRPCYTVWSIRTEGYTTYSTSSSRIDINRVNTAVGWRPLIQVFYGMTHSVLYIRYSLCIILL